MTMNRDQALQTVTGDIEFLTRLHILYRMENSPEFASIKKRITETIQRQKINVRAELNPLTLTLYRRYFS